MSTDKAKRFRAESKKLAVANQQMEKRLNEIKELFEKEQVKREKEALIWASSASEKKKRLQIDKQSRNILGKTYNGGVGSVPNERTKKIKVLKGNEPLIVPKGQNSELQKFINAQQTSMKTKSGMRLKSVDKTKQRLSPRAPIEEEPPQVSPKPNAVLDEEYALLSDLDDYEIFEIPLTEEGNLPLSSVKAICGARAIGVFCRINGRKRIIIGENDMVHRPSGGWKGKTFYPLEKPRTSRPSTRTSIHGDSPVQNVSKEYYVERDVKSGSLLNGNYDENVAAVEFQEAVLHFRGTDNSQTTRSHQTATHVDPAVDKIAEVHKLFGLKSLDSIRRETQQIREELETRIKRGQIEFTELEYIEKTREELDLEDEREEFRQMLLTTNAVSEQHGENHTKNKIEHVVTTPITTQDNIEEWPVPEDWGQTVDVHFRQVTLTNQFEVKSIISQNEMWLPTGKLNFDIEVKSISASKSEPEDFVDATIIDRVDIRRAISEDSLMEDGDEMEYFEASLDKELNLQISHSFEGDITGISRQISHVMLSQPRPISRASIMTDADLDKNEVLSRELNDIEQQFYPDDNYEY